MSESEADYQREMEIPEEYVALRDGSLPPADDDDHYCFGADCPCHEANRKPTEGASNADGD